MAVNFTSYILFDTIIKFRRRLCRIGNKLRNDNHQVLVYENVNLILYIKVTEIIPEVILNTCRDLYLTVNMERSKCMDLGRH